MAALLNQLRDDKYIIPYRRRLNSVTGGVLASLFFAQVIYLWDGNGCRPFYKFNEPASDHDFYRIGDSWTEEMGFTRWELEAARDAVAAKIKRNDPYPDKPVVFWRDGYNLTWYDVNIAVAEAYLAVAYAEKANVEKPHSLGADVVTPHSGMRKNHIRSNEEKQQPIEWGDTTFPISKKEILEETAESLDSSLKEMWTTALEELQLQLPRETFDTWLRRAKLVDSDGTTWQIGVHNVYAREWLDQRLRKVIERTLSRLAGQKVDVQFEVAP